jgi:hypothetical protein
VPLFLYSNGDEAHPDHVVGPAPTPQGWRSLGKVACALASATLGAEAIREFYQEATDEHAISVSGWPTDPRLGFTERAASVATFGWRRSPNPWDPGFVGLTNYLLRTNPEFDWVTLVPGSAPQEELTRTKGYLAQPDPGEVWGETLWVLGPALCGE